MNMFTSYDMVTEEDKYIANSFKIGGFAFMTMLANFILNIREEFQNLTIGDAIYFIASCMLFYFGMILLFKGGERVSESRARKWNHKKLKK